MIWLLPLALLTTPLLILIYNFTKYQIRNSKSPLRNLPGPKSRSWLYGNFKEIIEKGQTVAWDEWMSTYGKTFQYPEMFNTHTLFTTDPRAISHAVAHSDEFCKPAGTKEGQQLLGEGLVFSEGERHRKQRRIMNPAFGPAQLKSFVSIFNQKAAEVQNIWLSRLNEDNMDGVELDVNIYMSRATLDIIGLAGFGYEFDSLQSKEDEFSTAFRSLVARVSASTAIWTIGPLLAGLAPILSKLPLPFPGAKEVRTARKALDRIGNQLVSERKSALLQEKSYGVKGKSDTTGRDLLTLLVRANIQDADGMNDADIRAQISTFLVAGHGTTSAAMSWTFFGLSQNQEAQRKLREELVTLATDEPTMDELKALPYLDMVIRESLRLYSPAPAVRREVANDTVLPMKDGSLISMSKGDNLLVPIYAMNTDKDVWGSDAFEFKPERWKSLPEAVSEHPGVWSNLMTFLGGARACIGYQFTLLEMKSLLFPLIKKFEFGLVIPAEDIVWLNRTIVRRPFIKGAEWEGPKLPLRIKVHVPDA